MRHDGWSVCLGLSHEGLQELQRLAEAAGHGQQGRSRSLLDNALSLRHLSSLQQLGLSTDAAIKTVAAADVASPNIIRAVYNQFTQQGTLPTPSTAHRGKGNPDHPLNPINTDACGPSLEGELLMHRLIHTQQTDGVTVTATTIAAELRSQLTVDVSRRTVRRWLHALGYRWRSKRYIGGMKPQAKNVRIRQFILEYAAALAEEEADISIIVYMDESYIHAHHSCKKGWFHPSNPDVIGDGDGKRLIILHAMTDHGLLAVPDEVASNWLSEPALTAELVFEEVLEDGQDDSDYHNTMTGVKFVAWLRNRLLPTFNRLFPGKKMHLVLDNASYHKPRDETWISASQSMNKHELAHQLLDLGVEQLTTAGDSPRIIPAHRFEAAISAGGPSKDDLIAAVQRWLDEHPDHNRTVVEQLMDDAGYALIYTPPFCPEVQPIELLWAEIKRYVADRSTLNRSMTETREQTKQGFEQISKMFCNSIVRHCHDWVDAFIASEAAEDLQQCGSLAGVIKHLALLKIANETATTSSSDAVPMHIIPSEPSLSSSTRILRKRH